MVNQIKAISELTILLNTYKGINNIDQDLENLEEILDNVKTMPVQVDTLALIFNSGDEADQSQLAKRSSQLREEAFILSNDPQIFEAKKVQAKLRQLRDVSNVVESAEKFIKQYESTSQQIPNEKIIEIFAQVKKAQAITNSQLLPSEDSLD